jgi:hypothetical protein
MDVQLAQLAAVSVDRLSAADFDRTVGDEVLRLTPGAESQLLQLDQGERREMVVEHGGLDVSGLEPCDAGERGGAETVVSLRATSTVDVEGVRRLISSNWPPPTPAGSSTRPVWSDSGARPSNLGSIRI